MRLQQLGSWLTARRRLQPARLDSAAIKVDAVGSSGRFAGVMPPARSCYSVTVESC